MIGAVCLDSKIGNRQLAELDMVQMSGQVDLAYAMHPDAPKFNFTLDSDNTSLEETIDMIANAGFCEAYRQNGKIRLSFDRAQAANVSIYTHRNKKPNAETFARTFANDADYDGVEFVYQDRTRCRPNRSSCRWMATTPSSRSLRFLASATSPRLGSEPTGSTPRSRGSASR